MDSVNLFSVAIFKEHPVVDSTKPVPHEFDIVIDTHVDRIVAAERPSFDINTYCRKLFDKVCELPCTKQNDFIVYQCSRINDPVKWLLSLDELIITNQNIISDNDTLQKLESLSHVIEMKKQEIELERNIKCKSYEKLKNIRRYNIHAVKVKLSKMTSVNDKLNYLFRVKADYLQNVPHNQSIFTIPFDKQVDLEINLVKSIMEMCNEPTSEYKVTGTTSKIQINCQLNVFIDLLFQMLNEPILDGAPILKASVKETAEAIASTFIDKNGHTISVNTVKTILYPGRLDKRPKADKRINLQNLLNRSNPLAD